jgi:hypothetical protein
MRSEPPLDKTRHTQPDTGSPTHRQQCELHKASACKKAISPRKHACMQCKLLRGQVSFAMHASTKKLLRKGKIWQAYSKLLHSLPLLHQKHIPALSKTLGNKTNKIILHLLAQSKTQRGKLRYKTKILTLKTLTHGNLAA